jgi:type II restriction enzyme
MSKREDLRASRAGTIINMSSKKMESLLAKALVEVTTKIEKDFKVKLVHEPKVLLKVIVEHLRIAHPEVDFEYRFPSSYLLPDGGILYICNKNGDKHVLLISEAKRQGTNDARKEEGLPKQSKGNAIERLGKNVTGFRMWLSTEGIFPFVVFGQGVDFASDSSILDRVTTIAMFAPLNKIEVMNVGDDKQFNRGSFFFRPELWTVPEMVEIMYEISKRSVYYYFAKYGEENFH